MIIRILVTGSREWDDRLLLETVLYNACITQSQSGATVVIVHGDCPRGADRMAREWVLRGEAFPDITVTHEPHPYLSEHGKAGGPIRNQRMVDLGADLCLAFPTANSRGTWDCIKRANRAGIPVRIVPERKC